MNLLGIVVTPLKERTRADHFIDRWAEVTPQIALSSKGKVPNHNKTNGSITTVFVDMRLWKTKHPTKRNLRSGVPYIFCCGEKVRLIQLLDYLSAAPLIKMSVSANVGDAISE